MAEFEKTLALFIDGLSPTSLDWLLDRNKTPFLSWVFRNRAPYSALISEFPSVTPPAITSILTGKRPNSSGIPNFAWINSQQKLVNIMSVFDAIGFHSKLSRNGIFKNSNLSRKQLLAYNSNFAPTGRNTRFGFLKKNRFLRLLKKNRSITNLVWVEDRSWDWSAHCSGPQSPNSLLIFQRLDEWFESVYRTLQKVWGDSFKVIVFSDHGNEASTIGFNFNDSLIREYENVIVGCAINHPNLALNNLFRRGKINKKTDVIHVGAGGGQKTLFFPKLRRQLKLPRLYTSDLNREIDRLLQLKHLGRYVVEFAAGALKIENRFGIGIHSREDSRAYVWTDSVGGSIQQVEGTSFCKAEISLYPGMIKNLAFALSNETGGDLIVTSQPNFCFDQIHAPYSIHGGVRKDQVLGVFSDGSLSPPNFILAHEALKFLL